MNIEYELGDLVEYQRRELTLNEDDCYEANWVIDKGYIIAIEIQREISFTNKVKGYSVRYKVCPQFEGTPWGWNQFYVSHQTGVRSLCSRLKKHLASIKHSKTHFHIGEGWSHSIFGR